MKKTLSKTLILALALTMLLCFVLPVGATSGEQTGDSLKIVNQAGGAYVIVTSIEDGSLDFNYGWNNGDKFDPAAAGYWIGVYDDTGGRYITGVENQFSGLAPKKLKLSSLGTELISGREYKINFFVRGTYSSPVTNITELIVYFTAP